MSAIEYNDWRYIETRNLIPVRKKAGEIVNDRLKEYPESFSYEPMSHTPDFWKHIYQDVIFKPLVEDF